MMPEVFCEQNRAYPDLRSTIGADIFGFIQSEISETDYVNHL